MDIEADEIVAGCVVVGGLFLLMGFVWLYLAICSALVLSTFWAWFMLPVFPSLPAISMIQAIGITFTFGALNNTWMKSILEATKPKEENERTGAQNAALVIGIFVAPWLTLLIGHLFRTFCM